MLDLVGRLRGRDGSSVSPPRARHTVRYVVMQLPSWLLISGATWAVASGQGVDIGGLSLVLATCTSWVAGFLFLPTPGGIGIREAAFVAVLGGDAAVAAVALAARIVFVLVDAIGAAASSSVSGGAMTRGCRAAATCGGRPSMLFSAMVFTSCG